MKVAAIELSAGGVAELALRLHRAGHIALSWYVGRAVDHVRDELDLHKRDYRDIVAVIDPASPELMRLREALEQEVLAEEEARTAPLGRRSGRGGADL